MFELTKHLKKQNHFKQKF